MSARGALRIAVALVVAVLVTAAAGSVVQTQINLLSITGMGVAVPAGTRLATTAEDVVRFGPVMAAIAFASFLPAFAVVLGLRGFRPGPHLLVAALAGAAGLWTAFSVMGFFTPMPTLVAAVRTSAGLAAMCATGLLGGLAFGLLTRA